MKGQPLHTTKWLLTAHVSHWSLHFSFRWRTFARNLCLSSSYFRLCTTSKPYYCIQYCLQSAINHRLVFWLAGSMPGNIDVFPNENILYAGYPLVFHWICATENPCSYSKYINLQQYRANNNSYWNFNFLPDTWISSF